MSITAADPLRDSRGPDDRAQERLAFLEEASRVLASSLDRVETLATVAELAVPALADWCAVDLVEDGALSPEPPAIAHRDPAMVELGRRLRRRHPIRLDDPHGVARVLRTGAPELVPVVSRETLVAAARGPEHLEALLGLGIHSVMIVPLSARGRVVGALTLVTAESGRRFDDDDLALAQELAGRAAVALDNARLHGAEGEARRQAERSAEGTARLQEVTVALSRAMSTRDVGALVLGHAVEAMGARAGVVGLLSEDGREVRVLESRGYPIELVEAFRRFPVATSFPLADAIRRGRPVLLEDRATRNRLYPHLEPVAAESGGGALAALPLLVDGKTVGALGVIFDGPRRFDDEERHFLLALAGSCALAFERARLAEAQRRGLEKLEEMTRRLQALQAVTDVALGHLDLDDLLAALLERVVRVLGADAGKVLLADDDGVLHVRASRGLDEALLRDVRIRPGEGLAGRIAASRRATVVEAVGDDLLGPALRRRGIRSLAGAPLLAGDRLLGVLHVGSTTPGAFREDDLELLRVVAERAAVAVDRAALFEAQRAAAVENGRLYEESRHALAARDDLLAIVSHDLRNPLGAIVLNASVLEKLLPPGTGEGARRQLRMLQRSAERMNRLVGALLDAESLEAGVFGLAPEAVPTVRLLEESVEAMTYLGEARSVSLVVDVDEDPGEVHCDRERVLQVFSNLIANALRFSPEGSVVSVGGARAGDEVRFWVRDCGPGIAPELRERIFERHFQGRRGPGSGLGLGLYIARGIVASHGGRIWCEPAEGGGTSFVFTLPI